MRRGVILEIFIRDIRSVLQEKIAQLDALGFQETLTYHALIEIRNILNTELANERAKRKEDVMEHETPVEVHDTAAEVLKAWQEPKPDGTAKIMAEVEMAGYLADGTLLTATATVELVPHTLAGEPPA